MIKLIFLQSIIVPAAAEAVNMFLSIVIVFLDLKKL